VQIARDLLSLARRRQLSNPRFQVQALLAHVPDQIADDGKIDWPHDVEIGVAGGREQNQAEIQTNAEPGYGPYAPESTEESGPDDGESEERVERAAGSFSHGSDGSPKQHIKP
jgi:hypothetical protein